MHCNSALMRFSDYIGRTRLSVARSRLGLAVRQHRMDGRAVLRGARKGTSDANEVSFSAFSSTLEAIKGVDLRVFSYAGHASVCLGLTSQLA